MIDTETAAAVIVDLERQREEITGTIRNLRCLYSIPDERRTESPEPAQQVRPAKRSTLTEGGNGRKGNKTPQIASNASVRKPGTPGKPPHQIEAIVAAFRPGEVLSAFEVGERCGIEKKAATATLNKLHARGDRIERVGPDRFQLRRSNGPAHGAPVGTGRTATDRGIPSLTGMP